MSKIRVVLVEDHDLSRIGLVAALKQVDEIEVVGNAANGHQGLQLLYNTKPDVAIVDIGLPDIDGIELTQQFKQCLEKEETAHTKILILTMHEEEDSVLAAFAAGADSYSLKDASLETLVQAIQVTSQGNTWIDPNIARIVLQQAQQTNTTRAKVSSSSEAVSYQDPEPETVQIKSAQPDVQQLVETYPLTERELEVLELIVAGCSNAEIAERLYVTVGTVKTHVRNILNKLCVDDRTQAAVRALRSGIVG
ncbi:MAG: response regulator transcription factor [Microcoleaceae cyanobacterium]